MLRPKANKSRDYEIEYIIICLNYIMSQEYMDQRCHYSFARVCHILTMAACIRSTNTRCIHLVRASGDFGMAAPKHHTPLGPFARGSYIKINHHLQIYKKGGKHVHGVSARVNIKNQEQKLYHPRYTWIVIHTFQRERWNGGTVSSSGHVCIPRVHVY